MTRQILILTSLLLLASAGLLRGQTGGRTSPKAPARMGSITVRIDGIDECKGKLMIGLYDNPETFPGEVGYERGGSVRVTGAVHSYTFKDVPYGTWAIAIVHDCNENGKMDLNWLGLPSEGYAFSNNATSMFSAPDFEDASFKVNGDMTVKITMDY